MEQNGLNAHESEAKAHEKPHDFANLFSPRAAEIVEEFLLIEPGAQLALKRCEDAPRIGTAALGERGPEGSASRRVAGKAAGAHNELPDHSATAQQ
jgi:hypothetical protein